MLSSIWQILFKTHRKLYRIASPLICHIYSLSNSITVKKSLFIGFPYLAGKVSIDRDAVLVSLPNGNELGILTPCRLIVSRGTIKIGSNFQASGVRIFSNSSVTIGRNVMVGANCLIVDDDMHPLSHSDRISGRVPSVSKPITIKDDVWIGANVTILKGVTVGERSVIGSGVVVRCDVPPDTVVYHSSSSTRSKTIKSPDPFQPEAC